MGIGINLKLALKEYGMTVAELSRKTGISSNTFYAMIRRDSNKISPEMLKKICDNTDISVYELLDNYDELAAKYYDPIATEEEQAIGDYILTTMGNDDNLEHIVEIYNKLNNAGKNIAHEKISELEKSSQFTDEDSDNNTYKYDASIRVNHSLSPEAIENLKEVSAIYNKIENGEKLTENDLQILKDYNKRQELAMKRLKETLRTMQEKLIPLMRFQSAYEQLNEIGQEEAAKRIDELTEIPRYTKPDEPPQE